MANSDKDTVIVQTSKMELTIPHPETAAVFIAKVNRGSGSLRMTIPAEIIELLGIKPNDFIEVRLIKRKRLVDKSLQGGFQ